LTSSANIFTVIPNEANISASSSMKIRIHEGA